MKKASSEFRKATRCPCCNSENLITERCKNNYTLLRCNSCRLVFSDNLYFDPKIYESAYQDSNLYQGYLGEIDKIKNGTWHVAWAWRHFFKRVKKAGLLLDLGCSTGVFMVVAAQKGWRTDGIEVSNRAASIAQNYSNGEVFNGTIHSINNLHNSHYDAVTSWEVLEHDPTPLKFAANVYRALKPGGYWALSVPNWNSIWRGVQKSHQKTSFPSNILGSR